MEFIYILLGVIIFLLTFCAVGSVHLGDLGKEKEGGLLLTMSLIIGIILLSILGCIYFFFYK